MTACREAAEDRLQKRKKKGNEERKEEVKTSKDENVLTNETSLNTMSKCIFHISQSLNGNDLNFNLCKRVLLLLQRLPCICRYCTIVRQCAVSSAVTSACFINHANIQGAPHCHCHLAN